MAALFFRKRINIKCAEPLGAFPKLGIARATPATRSVDNCVSCLEYSGTTVMLFPVGLHVRALGRGERQPHTASPSGPTAQRLPSKKPARRGIRQSR